MAKDDPNQLLRQSIRLKIKETLNDWLQDHKDFVDVVECCRIHEILSQLRDVGWSRVTNCDKNFHIVTFSHSAGNEKLKLTVNLSKNFPTEAPICDDELPESFTLKKYFWIPEKSNLAQIFETFVERAESLIPVSLNCINLLS